jgi:hypothetical protein
MSVCTKVRKRARMRLRYMHMNACGPSSGVFMGMQMYAISDLREGIAEEAHDTVQMPAQGTVACEFAYAHAQPDTCEHEHVKEHEHVNI